MVLLPTLGLPIRKITFFTAETLISFTSALPSADGVSSVSISIVRVFSLLSLVLFLAFCCFVCAEIFSVSVSAGFLADIKIYCAKFLPMAISTPLASITRGKTEFFLVTGQPL